MKEAFKLVDAAKKAGAEIIKHQTHIIDDEMSSEALNIKPGNSENSIYNIMKQSSLNEKVFFNIFINSFLLSSVRLGIAILIICPST